MNKENSITIKNLFYALLFLLIGILLLSNTEDIISLVSKVIGSAIVLIGLIKAIIYIYMKGKIGNYSLNKLVTSLLLISVGCLLIFYSGALSFAIRLIVGMWTLFSGINRIIFAFVIKSYDKSGFKMYLISSLLMITIGVLLISGIFDQIIGAFIVAYACLEIIDYIYFKTRNYNYNINSSEEVKENKIVKRTKKLKKTKVVDAVIEEE